MYNLDAESAKKANDGNKFINKSGKYKGVFTRAENVKSSKGTMGVEFTFKTQNQEADYLTLWTVNSEGKQLYGYSMLMAIMACMKVKTISPVQQQIEKYDSASGGKVMKEASLFHELMNKPIGLILQEEEYLNGKGELKSKMAIFAPFEASTELTAGEILDRKVTPLQLQDMVSYIAENPVKKLKSGNQAKQSQSEPATAMSVADFDDDIPF